MEATNKDLKRWYDMAEHCKRGYCCEQQAKTPKYELLELGYNRGVYGWNWTAYYETATNTLYVSNYRNVPKYIAEK